MIQTVSLTLSGGFSHEEAFAVQSDRDLAILRCVLRGYRNQPGDTVLLRATKPDETVCYLAGRREGENTVLFSMTEQLTAVPGEVFCDLQIIRGTGTVSSDAFVLKIRPPAAAGEMTESSNEYIGLVDLIQNTVNAQEITADEIDAMWEEVT